MLCFFRRMRRDRLRFWTRAHLGCISLWNSWRMFHNLQHVTQLTYRELLRPYRLNLHTWSSETDFYDLFQVCEIL